MPKITLRTNLLVILLTLTLEALTIAMGGQILPLKYLPLAVFFVAFIPKVLSVLAQYSNPNGTAAELPWAPSGSLPTGAGAAAYEAYRAQSGGKSLATGAPIPAWSALPPPIQAAWETAAAAAKAS